MSLAALWECSGPSGMMNLSRACRQVCSCLLGDLASLGNRTSPTAWLTCKITEPVPRTPGSIPWQCPANLTSDSGAAVLLRLTLLLRLRSGPACSGLCLSLYSMNLFHFQAYLSLPLCLGSPFCQADFQLQTKKTYLSCVSCCHYWGCFSTVPFSICQKPAPTALAQVKYCRNSETSTSPSCILPGYLHLQR